MRVSDIMEALDGEVCFGEDKLNEVCLTACGCDLMSDALAFSKARMCLLTGLTNTQVVRTAEMLDVVAIVFVRGKQPSAEILALAEETGIAILRTDHTLYEACGILYSCGLPGRIKV